MKQLNEFNKLLIITLCSILIIYIFFSPINIVDENEVPSYNVELELEDTVKVFLEEIKKYKNTFNSNLDYIHPKFKVFNSKIDSNTTKQFVKVMMYYKLDSTEYKRKMYTGQILLESGAKQYKHNGDLQLSYAGAVGLCQIMPNTCRGYFEKYISKKDSLEMMMLGASDFSFAYEDTLSIKEKNIRAKEWLSIVDNNIIMWGYITKKNLERKGDIHKQLIAYNMGTSGMNRFLSNGGDCLQHKYICGIKNTLLVASK